MTASYSYPSARIALFLRAPVPGQVKTRLQASLGEARCLALYQAMVTRVIDTVSAAGLAPLELWIDSDPEHPFFVTHWRELARYEQNGADLGQRMAHAASRILDREGVERVLLIGADCPVLDAAYLEEALHADSEVVLGPAEDGGYVLIGLRRQEEALFSGVDWGSAAVLAQTRERVAQAGLSCSLLPTLWDVDRPEDLVRLEALAPPLRY